LGFQSACQFIQERLGLVGTGLQQHAGSGAFLRVHPVWEYQVTTTTRGVDSSVNRALHIAFARCVLWLY